MALTCDCGCKVSLAFSVNLGNQETAFMCEGCRKLHYLIGDEVHKTAVAVKGKKGEVAYLLDGKVSWMLTD